MDKVFPVSEDYINIAKKFDSEYNNEIEEIKNIFYLNLDNYEKEVFLDILNGSNHEDDSEEEDVQLVDISKEEVLEENIKEYVSISMIKTNDDSNMYNIVLFVPSENENIKKNILEYLNNINKKDMIQMIVFGTLDYYNIDENND